jgi:hypothetical protein
MNITTKTPQKSSIPLNATGYHDRTPTSPIKPLLSRIKANFGRISQNTLNFAARLLKSTAQNPNTHQKTTATKARRGFVNFI